jgi:hypothetical protein
MSCHVSRSESRWSPASGQGDLQVLSGWPGPTRARSSDGSRAQRRVRVSENLPYPSIWAVPFRSRACAGPGPGRRHRPARCSRAGRHSGVAWVGRGDLAWVERGGRSARFSPALSQSQWPALLSDGEGPVSTRACSGTPAAGCGQAARRGLPLSRCESSKCYACSIHAKHGVHPGMTRRCSLSNDAAVHGGPPTPRTAPPPAARVRPVISLRGPQAREPIAEPGR